jgi:hypothetical protein
MRNDESHQVRDSYSIENTSQLKQSLDSINFTRQNESELGQSTKGGLRPEFIKPQGVARKTATNMNETIMSSPTRAKSPLKEIKSPARYG